MLKRRQEAVKSRAAGSLRAEAAGAGRGEALQPSGNASEPEAEVESHSKVGGQLVQGTVDEDLELEKVFL